MALFKSGRKLYIARFRRVGDRKVYTWEQWHRDGQSARQAFTKALEREFPSGYKLLSVKKATAAEEQKILGGHSLSNPIGLLSAAVVGATAGATSVFVRHKLEETAAGKNPAFPGKPGERFAARLNGNPAGGRKRATNPTYGMTDYEAGRRYQEQGWQLMPAVREWWKQRGVSTVADKRRVRSAFQRAFKARQKTQNPSTGFSIAMVPRRGPRLVLPRVYASKAEAQQRARKIRRPFGTRTAIVPAVRNPYDAAAAASEGFHGRPVEETIEIVTPEHQHEYLAALGELIKLEVLAPDSDREVIPLKGFKAAWLAENEKRNQLFVCGGDQSLTDDQLRVFGVDLDTLHETEVLGPLAAVTYHTIKHHLGEQGGDANFRHVFAEEGGKLPVLVYRLRDGLVEIAGGSYTIPDEGITN